MRVLHVQKVKGIGGSERHLLTLLPALAERGVEVRMCVLATERADLFSEPMRRAGVETVEIPAGRDFAPSAAWRIAREIRRFSPDVVHTHLIHADLFGQIAARLVGVPGVSSMHATHDFYRREPSRSAARLAGRLAKRTIAISEHVRRFAIEHDVVPEDRIEVVHYGIDVSRWTLDDDGRERARREFGLEPDDMAVGVAARLIPRKGHDLLIEAVAKARAEAPQLRLLIAGSGPLRAELEAVAGRYLPVGTVRWFGHVEDVRSFFGACDIVAFPSLSEGFGLAALEGMASGRPVVGFRIASLPEVIEHGVTGLLADPREADGLTAALVRLLREPALREGMGTKANARARMFSVESMVERTVSVYRESVKITC